MNDNGRDDTNGHILPSFTKILERPKYGSKEHRLTPSYCECGLSAMVIDADTSSHSKELSRSKCLLFALRGMYEYTISKFDMYPAAGEIMVSNI